MDEILSATVDSRNGIVLDPRTKLFMLITITTLMFSTSNDGIMNIVKPILSLIPFALILSEHKFKTAGKYAVLYAVCFVLERLALNVWSGMISFLILAATSIMTRFAPGIMTGAYLISSTSVSQCNGADACHRKNHNTVVSYFPFLSYNQGRISGNPGCNENEKYPFWW